jgi:hypothetical protein
MSYVFDYPPTYLVYSVCITRCQHCWLLHIYQIFCNGRSYGLLVYFLVTTTFVENIKRLNGADTCLDSVG